MKIPAISASFFASFLILGCATSDHVAIGDGGAGAGQSASPTSPATTDAASFCAAMCGRVQACDKTLDTQTCENTCTNGNAAVFPRLRSDVVDLIVQCFEGKDCKTVLGGGFVGACAADAIATVAPSAAAASFCEALATSKKSCSGASSQTKADCLNTAKLYGDGAIAQAENCTKRGCSEIDTCVSAVFGSLGGGAATKPTPTATDCSGTFSDIGACSSCAQTSCCTQAAACAANSECDGIVHACLSGGTATTLCSSTYSAAGTSAQSLASTLFSCVTSKCSSTCRVGG